MPDDLRISGRLTIPGRELSFLVSRSSGAGGQAVNKTSSRVSLRWNVQDSEVLSPLLRGRLLAKLVHRISAAGLLQVHVESERSQHRNREIALERLRELIQKALLREKPRRPTKPSRGSRERRLETKKRQGRKKAERRSPPD
ncbi:MAG: alternative ribosome rescue aminoacyl-tRNA hydrolase ArfB [Deltaproteobacteria bacterium]